nr:SH3 domain-binding protein 1 isoform X3 [Phascolarctos cinereus]
MEKRVKKLPLMALSHTMAESIKELDPDSSMGKALEISCSIQSQLARVLAEFEMALERDVLQPLNRLSEEELPSILKHKKNLQKLVLDWNALKSRLSQMAKNSSLGPGVGGPGGHNTTTNKLETLKEEEEELKRKVEQSKDEYLSDLYHFATKEDSYANYFISLLELQASYHRKSLSSLDTALAELKETHGHTDSGTRVSDVPSTKVYGVALRTHLQETGRDVALPLEACVLMLLSEGMKEEGLFRLAAGASVLKRLKQTMTLDPSSLEEFCSDPHAVAGALKSYLRELPEPLMTSELYEDWLTAANLKEPVARLEGLQEVCGKLPQENLCNLRYLIKFLARLAKEQEVNKMTPSNIAIVLGPNLLWPPTRDGDQAQLDTASVSSIQVVGVVEALIQNSDTLFPGDIDFSVSGLFASPTVLYQPHSQEKFIDGPKSEEFPATITPPPVAKEGKEDLEPPPRPTSPKISRNPTEVPGPAEETARKTKRPAPARPMVPPPQVLNPRSSPPTIPTTVPTPTQPQPQPQSQPQPQPQPQPPTPGSPATPRALPRRQAGSNIKAPSVPPPLPPQPPQPVRRLSRPSPASPNPSAEPEVPGEPRGPEGESCAAGVIIPPQPRPRTLASETN